MPRIEKTVFISYRRTNFPWAEAVFQNLSENGFDVFMDYTGLASGDFETVIVENIRARAHFLVLLTPSALERCSDPGDWLRREIEVALDSKRNIIPLMLEGFDFSTPGIAKYLTGRLALLKQYNAMSVPMEYFDAAMAKLRARFLNVPLDAVIHPVSEAARRAATEQNAAAAAAPRVVEEELTAQQWFERGGNALQKGDLEEAVQDYDQAIHLKPDFAEAFSYRGSARGGKGDNDGALEDFNEAIRIRPDLAYSFDGRGIARLAKGDLDGALDDFNQAIRLGPGDAGRLTSRGIARSAKGDLDAALDDYNEAIRLRPDYADAYYNRGIAHYRKKDFQNAIEDFTQTIRLKPDLPEAFRYRAVARLHTGNVASALQDLDEAIRRKPDDAEAIKIRDIVLKDIASRAKT